MAAVVQQAYRLLFVAAVRTWKTIGLAQDRFGDRVGVDPIGLAFGALAVLARVPARNLIDDCTARKQRIGEGPAVESAPFQSPRGLAVWRDSIDSGAVAFTRGWNRKGIELASSRV
jgi:hypothetical protein